MNSLCLPDLSKQPAGFTIRTGSEGLKLFAERLARLDVLRPEHWNGDCADSCRDALGDFVARARPLQLVHMALAFTDYAELGEPDSYLWQNKIKENVGGRRGTQVTHAHEPPGAFIVCVDHQMENGPYHQVIGPVLAKLEKQRPRLGQTVLYALQRGLDLSCRGLTPRSGTEWASRAYWMGENDESLRAEEELEELLSAYHVDQPKGPDGKLLPPPTIKDTGVFSKKDYEDSFPKWAALGRIQPLPLASFRRLKLGKLKPIQAATTALLARAAHPGDTYNDCGTFEETNPDTVPYLLRWNGGEKHPGGEGGRADPLGAIWDDVMNDHSQCGEVQMNVNSVFAFHNEFTFRRALVRLRNFLQILHLTENLLRALAVKKEYVLCNP